MNELVKLELTKRSPLGKDPRGFVEVLGTKEADGAYLIDIADQEFQASLREFRASLREFRQP